MIVCDFCGAKLDPDPWGWTTFPCRDFRIVVEGAKLPGIAMGGNWLACPDCSPLVKARDLPRMIDRAIRAWGAGGDEAKTREILTAGWRVFFFCAEAPRPFTKKDRISIEIQRN